MSAKYKEYGFRLCFLKLVSNLLPEIVFSFSANLGHK